MARRINGVAVSVFILGGIVVYSGTKGISVLAAIRSLVAGKNPNVVPQTQQLASNVSVDSGLSTVDTPAMDRGLTGGNSAIANDALQYQGKVPYVFAGANPQHGWDCSGFVNYVIGHDLGLRIPGVIGRFKGTFHGPPASLWQVSPLCKTIPRNQASAGDLACWTTHIGIVIDGDHMINAYNFGTNTIVTGIESGGPKFEPLMIRRYQGSAA
jgi:hypothetical protein